MRRIICGFGILTFLLGSLVLAGCGPKEETAPKPDENAPTKQPGGKGGKGPSMPPP